MIDYPLALRLKEAGFPFKDASPFDGIPPEYKLEIHTGETVEFEGKQVEKRWLFFRPTLEELIEECRTMFKSLSLYRNLWWAEGKNGTMQGKTPSEAVASLYLSLHEKK